MINIERGQAPSSLNSPAIRQYLDELLIFQNLSSEEQEQTVKPSCPAYRHSDLVEAFDRDFYSKCYLTESLFVNSYPMDIEHFKSKALNHSPELRYEWTNLYPADHNANNAKPRTEPVGGYLDPCNPEDDVETEILYSLDFGPPQKIYFGTRDASNVKAVNTSLLLSKIHNGSDYESIKKTDTLRQLVFKKKEEVLETIIEWKVAKDEKNIQLIFEKESKLKTLLSRKSSFTMLIRSIPAVKISAKEFFD